MLKNHQSALGALISLCAALTLVNAAPAFASEADIHFERALQYEFQGNVTGALSEYRKGLEMDPNSVDGHAHLGTLLLEQVGDVDGAVSEFVTALGIDPQCSYCQTHLDEAVDRWHTTASENIARGNEFYRTGQLARAVAAYRVAVLVSPKNTEAHNSIAWTQYRLGNLDEAMIEVKEALRLKPEDPEYINTLACVLYDKGDLDGALNNWQRAISHSKKANAADLYGLAIGFLSKGETLRAIENFKEALKSDPNFADANYLRDKVGMSVHALAAHEKLLLLSETKK
jgi:eukaryotic-like serine/threonine-protein kinase